VGPSPGGAIKQAYCIDPNGVSAPQRAGDPWHVVKLPVVRDERCAVRGPSRQPGVESCFGLTDWGWPRDKGEEDMLISPLHECSGSLRGIR
jgi:hypothetical protein